MKNLFYGILNFLLIDLIIVAFKYSEQFQQPKHVGGVVVEKRNDFFLGYYMHIKYSKDNVETETVYQIFYERYEVGDTIKPIK
jgi:hypothetical protein